MGKISQSSGNYKLALNIKELDSMNFNIPHQWCND